MPTRYDNEKVIKRLKNGACVMKRICNQCREGFTGERNICPQCRNDRRRAEGKFGADYHNYYYHRYLSKMAMLHDAGTLSRNRHISAARRAAFEKQKKRVLAEIEVIREAGLDPDNDNIQTIERAGVRL